MTDSDEGASQGDLLTQDKQEGQLESSDAEGKDGVGQIDDRVDSQQAPACAEPDLPDQASGGASETSDSFASSAPVEGASTENAVCTHNTLPEAPTADEGGEPSAQPEEDDAPEISADMIAAAAAASNPGSEHNPLDRPASTATDPLMPQIMASDMPPPTFLPRQLRMKRHANRARAQATSNASVTKAPTAAVATSEEGGRQEAHAPADDTHVAEGERSSVDDEFALFMKEIQQLDSQREAEQQNSNPDDPGAAVTVPPAETPADNEQPSGANVSPPASESPQNSEDHGIAVTDNHDQQQHQEDAAVWQAVLDSASGKTYYWNVITDEVTWDVPGSSSRPVAVQEGTYDKQHQQQDLRQWAASTFRLTQELPTCSEKVQQLMFQLDFMEEELDAEYESPAAAQEAVPSEKADVSLWLQRFRSMRRQREPQRPKRSQEGRASGSDDELLKELIDLQLQQDRRTDPSQCPACKQRLLESRGTQSQQAKVRSVASSLARRLGNVEKEWASAMLAALKARLDDWIDGGLSSSFFLKRLDKMQQDFQKHLVYDVEAEGRHQELASVFPYSTAAATASTSGAVKASPRNCLAGLTGAPASDKGGTGRSTSGSRTAGAVPRGSSKSSEESTAVCTAPPTPEGPPPTLPDEVPPAASEAAKAGAVPAAGMSLVVFNTLQTVNDPWLILHLQRHPEADPKAPAVSREGAQGSGVTVAPAKRPLGSSGVKKISSSNPLVRKRMQLVEKWQKSREKDEESEEEDYDKRKERLKQKKIEEWKEREMASHRGMQNANFIEVTTDWRTWVQKK
ncbi:uncharacterized protein EMH_0009340 [Eimeria mitis]|uniref:WW domain-containing protein n=1 Tax=Eimeria mitis TaxID=44415 RepID=U6K7R2_9EIME|nr:uncharacterized protein EMH_0009340 [Eimeria mitis]CDJ31528.1 hypothetical protein, conserved [Eimeria mitis]